MRFEVLGPLRVWNGDEVVDLGGPRQQRVLAALLASSPDQLSVDRLVEEVWGDAAPDTAVHVIRTYLSNLRGVLGDRLESDGRHYRIVVGADELDAAALGSMVSEARSVFDVDPGSALDRLDEAAGLRRGPAFEGFADEGLLIPVVAASLEEQYQQAVELRTEVGLRLGHHAEILPELEARVRSHPLREPLTGQLMLALYRSGRQAEALRVYRELRNRLIEELGIEPSPALQALEERILLQDPGLDLSPPHNLPTPLSSFVGRADELATVVEAVRAHRLVTLTGVGGVGKSRLAREAALRLLEDFPDGVWWIDLAPVDDPEAVLDRSAGVLGLAAQPGIGLAVVLTRYLAKRSVLMVLDNCEHLVPEVGRVIATLLDAGPGVRVIATSRRAISLTGERRLPIPPMSLPSATPLDAASEISDSELLFVARAGEASGQSLAGVESRDEVAAICRRLDGIPLAIEMAAARTRALTPAQIVERLEMDPEAILRSSDAAGDVRRQTVEAAIRWSCELLSPVERLAFERLSVFSGSFDLAGAEAVVGFDPIEPSQVLDTVTGLVDASMLEVIRTDHTLGYRILQTVKDVGSELLETTDSGDEARRRHAMHHLDLVVEAGRHRMSPGFADRMPLLELAHDDLLVALDWLVEHDPGRAIEAAPGLAELWSRRGDSGHAYRYGTRLLDAAPDAPPELRAGALLCASFGAALSGDFDLAARGPAEALELSGEAGWQTRLWALHSLGQVGTILGDLDTVEAMGHRILELCDTEALDLPRAYGTGLLGLSEFFHDRDYVAAGRYLDEAIEGFRGLGDIGGMKIYGLVTASSAAALRGDYETATRYATEAISLPGPAWTAAAYIVLGGYTLVPLGELDRAGKVLDLGTRMAYETGTEIWMRTGFLFLARLAAIREHWHRAARLFGACRPNLPAWGRQPRWWDLERATEAALGDECRRLEQVGAAATAEAVLAWIEDEIG